VWSFLICFIQLWSREQNVGVFYCFNFSKKNLYYYAAPNVPVNLSGICTLDRKMTSFRQSENIIALYGEGYG